MERIAWFSPLPPTPSGIAAYSAEILPLLAASGLAIDTFTEANAHDFVWRHRRDGYELTVFQMGNAGCHDYMWAYLFRYPGLIVLHDAQLHQARALFLTRRWKPRRTDYLAEFRANHPDAPADVGELVAAGLGGTLYHHWPLTRLVIESARMTAVHSAWVAEDLRVRHPAARIEAIEMGVGGVAEASSARLAEVRRRHDVPRDAVVLTAIGGVTPEKRIPQLIRALGAIAERHPRLHLMLVGSAASHYDVRADALTWGVSDRVHVTGYVADEELNDYLRASDICSCLRWPTNRETSASWLRCLAAGRPTIVTELAHLADVPTVDPRGWHVRTVGGESPAAVAVSIDLLDEEHSLQLALERLATDEPLRRRLGDAACTWWRTHHQLGPMAGGYVRLIAAAMETPAPHVSLPPHLKDDGSRQARRLATDLGVQGLVADLLV
ncbi:MAG TPA: glycosyltransferase family 4 protein [Vicinamibacterales bacterium]|nr:glycosyltransferase family 4 protein [Vicinamibacterales bacterium]